MMETLKQYCDHIFSLAPHTNGSVIGGEMLDLHSVTHEETRTEFILYTDPVKDLLFNVVVGEDLRMRIAVLRDLGCTIHAYRIGGSAMIVNVPELNQEKGFDWKLAPKMVE